jgi:predicted GNAT family acetyltransferase
MPVAALINSLEMETRYLPIAEASIGVEALANQNEKEVLAFLSERPIHTVALVGFIRDNGLVSPLNRGAFYGCRNRRGQLEGVGLIGHATLIETHTDRALEALAEVAQKSTTAHLIMGEEERIDEFWTYYSEGGQEMRRACRELLFELRWPVQVREEVPELRLATFVDLDLILPVHAQMAFDESGIDPLQKDSIGFRKRSVRRIEQGRTWIWIQDGKLMFKAEIVSDTPEVIYLEGVWVSPGKRCQGYGLRCMSQLARTLLPRTQSICLLVNDKNKEAHQFYTQAGYKPRGIYDTIFLK